ncbi:MAG TPA: helix-turn-helix transcriptional regulator [Ktedonosporobacter sp.]|nr:helix-turn-helix transcriptional regulator [Ktedonosporobacter sp.]
MTISCHLRVLLARVNVERVKQGKPTLSLRRLAEECGVSLSAIAALNTGHSQRIDFATADRLLNYFSRYFTVSMNDLLVWECVTEAQTPVLLSQGIHAEYA